jgi:hypothetical protein
MIVGLAKMLGGLQGGWTLVDAGAWRMDVTLAADRAGGSRPAASKSGELLNMLRTEAPSAVVIVRAGVVRLQAHTNAEIETARRLLDRYLLQKTCSAVVTVEHRDGPGGPWRRRHGPYQAPRTRHGGRPTRLQSGTPLLTRRTRSIWLAIFIACALAGATWYALAPDVASFQTGYVLVLPMLIVGLVWLHHRIPTKIEWVVAIAVATTGPVMYLLVGGSDWWFAGQLMVLPLVILVTTRVPSHGPERWYGGFRDGPWGPP